ncbi:hypothetical protein BGW42_007240 [Actinomortierella wolfii]|nr:hypothetical protein BGW42_007240 [Actinomortierella wolfii]
MWGLTIFCKIGSGGYGTVHYAHLKTRPVAIKCITVTATDEAELNSIRQEVTVLHRLRDKHVINFYDAFLVDDQLLLLAMEFAEGGSLQAAINSRALSWSVNKRIAQEIIRGLAYIHGEGITHCDLKSSNILLTKYGEVKIADFGLAIFTMDSTVKARRAKARGSLRWMAPELLTKSPKYSPKSDIYALAMVMWEMAAKKTQPFKDQVVDEVVAALVQGGDREDLPDDTPEAYRERVHRCWDQNPMKRPNAIDMVDSDCIEWSALQTSEIQWKVGSVFHVDNTSSCCPLEIVRTQPSHGPMTFIDDSTSVLNGSTKRPVEDVANHVDDMKLSAGDSTGTPHKRKGSRRKRRSRSSRRDSTVRSMESSVDEASGSSSKLDVTFRMPDTSTLKPGKSAHKSTIEDHIHNENCPVVPLEYPDRITEDSFLISELSNRMSGISPFVQDMSSPVPRKSALKQASPENTPKLSAHAPEGPIRTSGDPLPTPQRSEYEQRNSLYSFLYRSADMARRRRAELVQKMNANLSNAV